ncbi:hypothetical protein BLOT_015426 [Blomia tropicalis]|nr:hypothetical protein BLOT_015426 [Blomia tropicalis]
MNINNNNNNNVQEKKFVSSQHILQQIEIDCGVTIFRPLNLHYNNMALYWIQTQRERQCLHLGSYEHEYDNLTSSHMLLLLIFNTSNIILPLKTMFNKKLLIRLIPSAI